MNNIYWFDNNPALTHFLSALSTLFNKGEGFFMKSITHYLKDNPDLKSQVIKFCKEEVEHTKLHTQMNNSCGNKKLLNKLEQRTGTIIDYGTKYLNSRQKLVVTAALEHITCSLAEELLTNKSVQDLMQECEAKQIWLLHSKDESSDSHKSMAYTMLQRTSSTKTEQYLLMTLATIILSFVITEYWSEIMLDDTFRGLPQALKVLLHPSNGFITNIVPKYLEWFSKNYTP